MKLAAAMLISTALLSAGEFAVGSKVSDLRMTRDGSPVVIKPGAAKATAVVFVSTKCPISNAYNARMAALYNDYKSKGVQFAFVNPNTNEPVTEIEEHAKSSAFPFKVYKDVDNVLADQLNAQYTPEVFLFDASGTLAYHGYIDDARNEGSVKVHGTRNALDALLAGKPVEMKETKAFGCTIKRAGKKTS